MYKTKQEALDRLAVINDENYYSHTASARDPHHGVWSKSALKSMAFDPVGFIAHKPFMSSEAVKFGSLVDILATEPHRFNDLYYVSQETDKRKKGWLEAVKLAEAIGAECIAQKDLDRANECLNALQNNAEGAIMLQGEPQRIFKHAVLLRGPLGELWIPLKARLDFLVGDTIYDLKTTGRQNPNDIVHTCRDLAYHWQDALYTLMGRANGVDIKEFKFVFVGTESPFHVQPVRFHLHAREQALKGLERALSMVYWMGFGHGLDRIYDQNMVLGDPAFYEARERRDYWDNCPHHNLPQIEVVW